MAMTPRRRSSADRLSSLAMAPRSLNEPVACMFSCFTNTLAPVSSDRRGAGSSGVCSTWPAMRSAARRTSSRPIAWRALAVEPAVLGGGLDHRVFAGHLIGEGRHPKRLLHAPDDVEVGQPRLDHDHVGPFLE